MAVSSIAGPSTANFDYQPEQLYVNRAERKELEKMSLYFFLTEDNRNKASDSQLKHQMNEWLSQQTNQSKYYLVGLSDRLLKSYLYYNSCIAGGTTKLRDTLMKLANINVYVMRHPWEKLNDVIAISTIEEGVTNFDSWLLWKDHIAWYFHQIGYTFDDERMSWYKMEDRSLFTIEYMNRVTLDYLLAARECEIMTFIWNEVSRAKQISIHQVKEHRDRFIGDEYRAIKNLSEQCLAEATVQRLENCINSLF